jgi:glycosyltransferase involved in cell wall biosynthesis
METLIVHIVPTWPSFSQTFILDDISASLKEFTMVKVFPLFGKGKHGTTRLKNNMSVKSVHIFFRVFILHFVGIFLFKFIISTTFQHLSIPKRLYVYTSACYLNTFFYKSNVFSKVVIHAHFISTGSDVANACKLISNEVAVVVTCHGSDVFYTDAKILSHRSMNTNAVVCASKSVEKIYLEKVNLFNLKPKVLVRYCRAPNTLSQFDSRQFDIDHLKIITVARFHPQKGLLIALEIARLLKILNIEFEWNFVGDGELRGSLEEKIAEYDLLNCVNLLGIRSREETLELISCHDFMVLPSIRSMNSSDGLPVAILESMSLGVPVFSTNVGGIAEALAEGRGMICESNPESFLVKIQDWLDNGSTNNMSRLKAREWVETNCFEGPSDPLRVLYSNLLSNSRLGHELL